MTKRARKWIAEYDLRVAFVDRLQRLTLVDQHYAPVWLFWRGYEQFGLRNRHIVIIKAYNKRKFR